MTSEPTNRTKYEPAGVQRDSETPVPKKPSFLFLVSTSLGILFIILAAVSAYYGIVR